MEIPPFWLALIILTGVSIYLLKTTFSINSIFLSASRQKMLDHFFTRSFHYYTLLNEKEKRRFNFRVNDVAKKINIQGREGFEITEAVYLYTAAAHVQLTFGFKRYFLSKFKTVIIYPGSFLNKMTGKMHDGEVNPRGVIVLSWEKFVKGYKIPDDKINLGLHEMAHALMHTILHSDQHEIGLDNYMRKIVMLSKHEIAKIKSNNTHFFRKYAGTNIYEFFAVAIENFFEVPREFEQQFPKLYQHISELLKQNPAKRVFSKY